MRPFLLPNRKFSLCVVPAILVALSVSVRTASAQAVPQIPKSLAELKKIQQLVKAVTVKLRKATVGVRVKGAQGSGVIINEKGFVLTAAHVAGKANQSVILVMPDGSQVQGRSLGLNRTMDAALIKIESDDDKKWPFMPMAKKSVKEGDWCIAVGHPGGFRSDRAAVLRLGRVISLHPNAVVTDCTLVGGDSGGPLANLLGEIIGIHSRIGSSLTSNMHVPIKAYQDGWDRLAKGDTWGHLPGRLPYIGVKGDGEKKGARIQDVVADSPASKAGLKVGDVVMEFAGKKVVSFESLYDMVQDTSPGDKVKLTVKRANKKVKITLTIGRRGRRR